jgi:hypothetical protein
VEPSSAAHASVPLGAKPQEHHHDVPVLFPHLNIALKGLQGNSGNLLRAYAKPLKVRFPLVNNTACCPMLSGVF